MFDPTTKESFTLEEVLILFGYLRPRRQTLTIVPYIVGRPEVVFLQHNPKCDAWLFPGGGQEGTESHGHGVLRELGQENPVLIQHIQASKLSLFTVCTVVRTGHGNDLGCMKSLPSFLSLTDIPEQVVAFLSQIRVPLHLGTDIVMSIPVSGEPDLSLGVSDESTEMRAFDLANETPNFGFHHGQLALDWLEFCRTSQHPTPMRTYEFC